jgi:hypothetical protein
MVNGEGGEISESSERSRVIRHLEKSWPIGEQLKNNKAKDLFAWIGKCIAEVVQDGCLAWPGEIPDEIPLGVTFSFPMKYVLLLARLIIISSLLLSQSALSEAKLLPSKQFSEQSITLSGMALLNRPPKHLQLTLERPENCLTELVLID